MGQVDERSATGDDKCSRQTVWGCGAAFATLCAVAYIAVQLPALQRHPPEPAWLPLIPISLICAGVAGAVSPHHPLCAGLPALLAPSALGLLAAFVGSCGMARWWELLVVLGTLLAVATLPGLLLLCLVAVTCRRYGDRARWVAITPALLIVAAVGAWSIADHAQQARLVPVKADVERLVREVEAFSPTIRWYKAVPRDRSRREQVGAFSGSTPRGFVRITGLPQGSGLLHLSDLTLTNDGGPALTISYGDLAPAEWHDKLYGKQEPAPAPPPVQTPQLLSQRGLLRDDIASRFVPVRDASGATELYKAHLHGLTLWYAYHPPKTYSSGSGEISFLGRYDTAQP